MSLMSKEASRGLLVLQTILSPVLNSGPQRDQYAPSHRAISLVPGQRIARDTLLLKQDLEDEKECGERIMGRLENTHTERSESERSVNRCEWERELPARAGVTTELSSRKSEDRLSREWSIPRISAMLLIDPVHSVRLCDPGGLGRMPRKACDSRQQQPRVEGGLCCLCFSMT